MRPRTLVIVGVVMFVGAVVLRFLVVQFGLLPVSEEVVLKKAVALKVTFFDSTLVPVGNGKAKAFANPRKSVWIDDPAEVSEALAALHMKADGEDARYGSRVGFGAGQFQIQIRTSKSSSSSMRSSRARTPLKAATQSGWTATLSIASFAM